MVLDLLGKVAEVWPIELVGFAKKRIERLCRTIEGALILTQAEHAHENHPHRCVWSIVRFDEQFLVLHHLGALLQHPNGLVEVDWHGYLGEILANRVFYYFPNLNFFLRILKGWQAVPKVILNQALLSSGDCQASSVLEAVIFILEVSLFDNLTSVLFKLQIVVGRLASLNSLRLVPSVTQLHG